MTPAAWPGGRAVAVAFTIAYESWADGGAPAVGPMGNPLPQGIPDLQARSWGRYGSTTGIRRLQSILDARDVRGTVMVSGVIAEEAPETVRALTAAGHDVCAHSYSQDVLPGTLDKAAERADIARCADLLDKAGGVRPRGWMSPRGTPSPNTGALLAESGFTWHGDCFDSDVPYVERHDAGDLVAIPFHMEINDMPVLIRHGGSPEELVNRFRAALSWALAHEDGPVHLDVTAHAHVLGRLPSAWAYEAMLDMVAEDPRVWCATRSEIAELVLAADATATIR